MPGSTIPQATVSQDPAQALTNKPGLFSFQGRMGRLRYFLTFLITTVVYYAILIAIVMGGIGVSVAFRQTTFFIIGLLLALILFVIYVFLAIAISLKRFHDLNKSAWWMLTLCIPFYNTYVALGLWLQCGTEGPNKYGQDPLPVGAKHQDFLNSIGSSVWAKIIIMIVFFALVIYGSIQNYKYQHLKTSLISR